MYNFHIVFQLHSLIIFENRIESVIEFKPFVQIVNL